jgi:hypothetical protein
LHVPSTSLSGLENEKSVANQNDSQEKSKTAQPNQLLEVFLLTFYRKSLKCLYFLKMNTKSL